MNVRFYNAGNRIDETFAFSHEEGLDIHVIGRWPFRAPREGWLDVPSEIALGTGMKATYFVRDIKQKFGPRGVVMLDPAWDPAKEDPDGELWKYPQAPTEELVIERGNKLWNLYLRKIVEGHLADCQSAMAAGGAPRAAGGFTKAALKLLSIQDPGEQYFLNLQKGVVAGGNGHAGVSDDVKAILASQGAMMQTMMALVLQMAAGQKLDPEAIKAAMAPVQTPDTLTSGIMTGKAKPIENKPDGLEAYDRKVKPKADRSKAAVAAL